LLIIEGSGMISLQAATRDGGAPSTKTSAELIAAGY
jgi:hypothetical protein